MKLLQVIFLSTLLISINARKSKHKGWKVNEGASTTTAPDSESSPQDEDCELKMLAEEKILITVGQIVNYDGNLTTYVEDNEEEIGTIYELDEMNILK